MTSQFSNLPVGHLPTGGFHSTVRRSNVIIGGAPSVIGAPIISNFGGYAPVVSTIGGPAVIGGGLRRSTVISGAPLAAGGLRGSYVINKDQIPAGADIIRVEQPAQYIIKNQPPTSTVDVRTTNIERG